MIEVGYKVVTTRTVYRQYEDDELNQKDLSTLRDGYLPDWMIDVLEDDIYYEQEEDRVEDHTVMLNENVIIPWSK